MSIEKIHCKESQKLLSQQLLFDVPVFRFYFVSVPYYLGCYGNEYPVKQTD